ERPHQGLGNAPLSGEPAAGADVPGPRQVRCRQRLGGLSGRAPGPRGGDGPRTWSATGRPPAGISTLADPFQHDEGRHWPLPRGLPRGDTPGGSAPPQSVVYGPPGGLPPPPPRGKAPRPELLPPLIPLASASVVRPPKPRRDSTWRGQMRFAGSQLPTSPRIR